MIPNEDAVGSSDPDNLDEIHDLDGMPLEINSFLAFNILDKIMEKHCQPTVDTYSALIAGLCKSSRLLEAGQLIINMLERGLCPNEAIYTTLINGHCK